MKKVLVRGPLLSKSGYGEHSRQVYRFLLEKPGLHVETQILPWGITPWKINMEDPIVSDIINRSSTLESMFDVSIQVQLPNEWDTSLAKCNVGVTAAVETDICNPAWTSTHVTKMDKVIVPSTHIKRTLGGNSIHAIKNIEVVPEAFYDEILEDSEDIGIKLETSFNFLTVGVLTARNPHSDRKNLFFLIKWFIEAFKSDPDVGLIIKTCQGRESIIDRMSTKMLLKSVLKEVGHDGTPKVYLLHGSMTREEMTSLYRHDDIKAFVSLTRGEGFGLPHLESAASSLPVIATDWSAHTEFLNLGSWIKIDYDLQPLHSDRLDNQIFVNGARWAEPRELDFKEKIKKFRKSDTEAKNQAADLMKKVHQNYSWKAVRKHYNRVLSEMLD